MSILHGPVVFIDDEIRDSEKPAYSMKVALEANGRPVAAYEALPDEDALDHWRSLAFLVLDWDLSPGSLGGLGAATLGDYQREALFVFLEKFMAQVFCPIFVVSAEDVADIERQITTDGRFGSPNLDTRIKVFGKRAVAADLVAHLEQWVESNLTLSVLKVWESQYEIARNRMFIDFNQLDSSWPTYVWRAALLDKVEPSYELATTVTANLLHRIDLMTFDGDKIAGDLDKPLNSTSMRRVLNGRTVIPGHRLHDNVVMPGDMFLSDDDETIWLNLTPACHTVPGRLGEGEDVKLYVVPGVAQEFPPSKRQFENLTKESPNSFLVHALNEERPYLFDLKKALFVNWGGVSAQRIGRLLAPYITRAQQANAMFMQIEGVPRVTYALYEEATA